MRTRAVLLTLVAAAFLQPVVVHAQRTNLSVTGFPVNFAAPTGADFDAGFIESASAITFTVDAQTGTTGARTTTVSIRCAVPCPTTGSKSVSTLSWRRADGTWNVLSTTDAAVETRVVYHKQPLPDSNDPWSNSIYFRFALGWLTDPPNATANQYSIIITLTVTVP